MKKILSKWLFKWLFKNRIITYHTRTVLSNTELTHYGDRAREHVKERMVRELVDAIFDDNHFKFTEEANPFFDGTEIRARINIIK